MELHKWALGTALAFCACASSGSQKSQTTGSNAPSEPGYYGVGSNGIQPGPVAQNDSSAPSEPGYYGGSTNGAQKSPVTTAPEPSNSPGEPGFFGQSATGTSSDKATIGMLSGTVAQVWNNAVKIETADGSAHILAIVPETEILVHGQAATPSDLEQGQDVRASYNVVDGRDTATRIRSEPAGSTGTGGERPPANPGPSGATGTGTAPEGPHP